MNRIAEVMTISLSLANKRRYERNTPRVNRAGPDNGGVFRRSVSVCVIEDALSARPLRLVATRVSIAPRAGAEGTHKIRLP